MKANAPKKIVCSVLISLLQLGGNAYIAEAASREAPHRTQHESRDTHDHLLDIPILDHVILGYARYTSFKENGLL